MKKVSIEIYEPAMCCSTGLCGPGIDPELLRLSTLTNSLEKKGIQIKRYNLSSEPHEFISNKLINEKISKEGNDILPITLVDGEIAKTQKYPSNDDFSNWLGVSIDPGDKNEKKDAGCCGDSGCCQ